MGIIHDLPWSKDDDFVEFRTESTVLGVGGEYIDIDNDTLWRLLRWFAENKQYIRTPEPDHD